MSAMARLELPPPARVDVPVGVACGHEALQDRSAAGLKHR